MTKYVTSKNATNKPYLRLEDDILHVPLTQFTLLLIFCKGWHGSPCSETNQKRREYALLTYGNMPVQPRFRVKFLLKFKYENVVRLAFQKKFYSKTRMDGHITIREKSVLNRVLTALKPNV